MEQQPKPVRAAFLWFSGLSAIIIGAIPVLQIFGAISWTADQIAAATGFIGFATATVGGTIASIYAENRVTPVSNPRDNSLVPLVPIADDGFEDEDEEG